MLLRCCSLFIVVVACVGCAHDEIVAACSAQGACDDGFDVNGCISEREGKLSEAGTRCGADAEAATLKAYTCFADASCDDALEDACADELAAFEDAATEAGEACDDAPRPLPPR